MSNKNPRAFIGIGVAIGVAMGIVFDNLVVGIAVGIALGAAITAARSRRPSDGDPKARDQAMKYQAASELVVP